MRDSRQTIDQAGIEETRRTRTFYDTDAASYDLERWVSVAGQHNNRTQVSIVRELLPEARGRLVEIGCGTGRFSTILAEQAQSLVLIDLSKSMLQKVRPRVAVALPLLGDVSALPLEDESICGLACLNVLSHVTSYQVALREIGRVLRPGGFALLNFNNLTSPYLVPGLIVNRRRRSFRANVFSQWISWSAFRSALHDAGLIILASKGHLSLPVRSPQPLVRLLSLADSALRNWPTMAPLPFVLAVKQARTVSSREGADPRRT